MTAYVVAYLPEARAQLISLYNYILEEASPRTAKRFIDGIVEQCDRLDAFPFRGVSREDIRPGLRTMAFRRVVIAYFVETRRLEPGLVTIAGVFYGGQDYETILADDDAP